MLIWEKAWLPFQFLIPPLGKGFLWLILTWEHPRWLSGKESACQCRRHGFHPWVRKIPWRRIWQLTPVILPGKSHGQKSLVHYIPRVTKSDMTERPSTHYTNWWVCVKAHKLYIKLTWSSQWHFEVGIVILQMGKSRLAFFTCKALLHENFWSCHWERCGVNLSCVTCSVVHSLPQP